LKDGVDGALESGVRPIGFSSINISPSVGHSKPATIRKEVVLPQPDGPSNEKNSPLLI
jgi:hypothetical protein